MEAQQPLLRIGEPEVATGFDGGSKRTNSMIGRQDGGLESCLVAIFQPVTGGRPERTAGGFKQASDRCRGRAGCQLVSGDFVVYDPVETRGGTDPDLAPRRRKNRRDQRRRQALALRKRSNSKFAEAVHSVFCRGPNVTLVIFKECPDQVTGQSVHLVEAVNTALVHMEEALAEGPDPKPAI